MAIAKASIRLATPSSREHLRTEEASVGFPKEDLDRHHLGARVIAGMRIRVEVDLLEVRVSQLRQGLLADAGLRDGGLEDLADRGALRPAISRIASGNHVRGDPSLPVGRTGERDQRPLPGDKVLHFDRVADREDVGVARAHVLVNTDAPALADLEPGRLRERGFRPHADGQNHDVRRMRLAGAREHFQRSVRHLSKAGHAVIEFESDAVLDQVAFDKPRHLRIERRHHLVQLFDERHLSPRWTRFSTISRPMNPPPTTTARFGFVTTCNPVYEFSPVRVSVPHAALGWCGRPGRSDREDSREVDAGKRRPDRGRAGRQHELS